jgi:outer membrane protein, heavy metal efflux system
MRRPMTAVGEVAPGVAVALRGIAVRKAHRLEASIAVAGFLLLSACGSIDPALQTRVEAEADQLSPQVDDDEAVQEMGADYAAGDIEVRAPLDMPENAGLEEYVAFALQRNPSIHRAIRAAQMAGFRVPQVTSLQDPMLAVVPPTGNMVETAAGMMDGGVEISQTIPFPGRLSRRGKVAEQEVRMALATLNDVRIRVVSDVARAYYEYYLAEVSIDITRASAQLLDQMRSVAAARYRTGSATQQDVLRAEVELYALTNEIITLEQRHSTSQARLNTLMDRPVDAPLPAPSPFDLATVDWKLPDAMDRAVESNPQLVRLREQVLRDLERIRLAKLEYYPDLRASFSYNFIGSGISPVATGDDNWSLPLGLNLPIWWKRLRAGVLEANAGTLSSVEQLEEARNTILFGLQDTLVKVDTQYRQAILFRDLIVPRARQTVEVSTAAYRTGDLEFTALIENWRNWLDFSLAYYRALAGLEQRFADLQQLIGARVPRDHRAIPDLRGTAHPTATVPSSDSIITQEGTDP